MLKKDSSEKSWSSGISSPKIGGSKVITSLLLILFLASAGGFGWTFYKYRQTKKELFKISSVEGQREVAKKEVDDLLAKVKKHIVLPEGEEPVVATVTDKEALSKEQPFYASAHNGDRVIAYMTARKAIIYDTVHDIVVNAGPIYVDGNAQTNQNKAPAKTEESNKKAPEKLNIEIRNGSKQAGEATKLADQLKTKFNITNTDKAANENYKGLTIVDLSQGKKAELIKALETELKVQAVTALPNGEKTASSDALVILGN